MITAPDWLARRAELSPTRVALIDPEAGERITYRHWHERATRTAHALCAAGVRRGDRVAVLAETAIPVLDLLFACARLGAIFQPLNLRLADPELAAILAHAGPRALVCDATHADRGHELLPDGVTQLALAELETAPARGALPDVHRAPDDPWVLCYTGGSTGRPRGVVQTHASVTWNAIDTVATWGLREDDVAILNAPLYHAGGLHVFTTPLVHAGGASIVCRRFDPAQVLALVDGGDPAPTLLFGVPTRFLRLVEHPRFAAADLSRLRLVITGGAAAPARLYDVFTARGVAFRTGYGLTEAGPNNFWLPAELARAKAGSVGWPLLHVEAQLRDDGGDAITAHDAVGELHLRGRHVMAGYLDDPDATSAAIDPEGWLATGDLARRDSDGAWWIVGRRKEMFISGGENVYPAEVEDALCDHPAVLEAAVVPVPDPVWGEVGVAWVAPRPGREAPSYAELELFVRQRLARYKVPRRFRVVAELPRTGAGKLDRQALRARAAGG